MTDKITIERETLLPCPFCGCGAAITGTEWGGREQYFVACTGPDCHCAVGENYDRDACPEYSFSSKAEAIAAWNRRAALAAQPAEPAYTHADVAEAHAKGYALGLRQVDRPHPTDAQPTGQSPCARHCEAPAFEGEIRRLKREATIKDSLTIRPPAPAAVPLTDEQIDDICWNFNCSNTPLVEYDRLIARAIERAHGIAAAGDKP